MKKETTIYGVKTGDVFHYIGKTDKDKNSEGNINKSDINYQYRNKKIRNVFVQNPLTDVIPIMTVNHDEWYDEKLKEVVKKYNENNPLVNAQWMLDGKRGFWDGTQGYWIGKKRDANTLQRLSESKFQKFCQYDNEGGLIKIWESGKEAGEKVFGDYHVVKGAGISRIYTITKNAGLKNRLAHNCYWFKAKELLNFFGCVPKKLNLAVLFAEEQRKKHKTIYPLCKRCGETDAKYFYPNNKRTCKICISIHYKTVFAGQKRYTVNHFYPDGRLKQRFLNAYEAAYVLKTSITTVQRLCRGKMVNSNYILKYGEKVLQKDCEYPSYEIQPLKKDYRPSKAKQRLCTRTKYSVELIEDKKVIRTFTDISEAANYFKLKESTVRRLCREGGRNKIFPYGTYLKLGQKIQTILQPKVKLEIPEPKPIVFEEVPKIIQEVKVKQKFYNNEKEVIIKNVKKKLFPKINTDNMFDDIDL